MSERRDKSIEKQNKKCLIKGKNNNETQTKEKK